MVVILNHLRVKVALTTPMLTVFETFGRFYRFNNCSGTFSAGPWKSEGKEEHMEATADPLKAGSKANNTSAHR